MKYIIDTSFFIALMIPNDTNHEKAKKILSEKQILHSDVIFNNFIIEEVFTVLTYKWWREISKWFYKLLNVFNIIFPSTGIYQYIEFYNNFDIKISFADMSIIYDWLKHNCELITFDKQQEKIFLKFRDKL